MAVVGHLMEFANDPGPYPITTVRELAKWGPRVKPGDVLEVTGIHGCNLQHQWARVVSVKPYKGPVPRGVNYSPDAPLIGITLERRPARDTCCKPGAGTPHCWDCPDG